MKQFSDKIITWYNQNKRDLPWRDTTDPYLIWLSEIILQQTRVDQGKAYYFKFAREFPTIKHLAKADNEKVMKVMARIRLLFPSPKSACNSPAHC